LALKSVVSDNENNSLVRAFFVKPVMLYSSENYTQFIGFLIGLKALLLGNF